MFHDSGYFPTRLYLICSQQNLHLWICTEGLRRLELVNFSGWWFQQEGNASSLPCPTMETWRKLNLFGFVWWLSLLERWGGGAGVSSVPLKWDPLLRKMVTLWPPLWLTLAVSLPHILSLKAICLPAFFFFNLNYCFTFKWSFMVLSGCSYMKALLSPLNFLCFLLLL